MSFPYASDHVQSGWRVCQHCACLFFDRHTTKGLCVEHGVHEASPYWNFRLSHDNPNPAGQPGWRWCCNCEGLVFKDSGKQECANGGPHDFTDSGEYDVIQYDPLATGSSGFRYCRYCSQLYDSRQTDGSCASGGAHDPADSGDYTVNDVRSEARRLATAYLPTKWPAPEIQWIADKFTPTPGGTGTTCAHLCHWLLWQLGCEEYSRINRDDPARGYTFTSGSQNISRLVSPMTSPFVPAKPGSTVDPKEGDIVFIKDSTILLNPPPGHSGDSEHVFVFLELQTGGTSPVWHTAEGGQGTHMAQEMYEKTRPVLPALQKYRKVPDPQGKWNDRRIVGWLDLDLMTYR
jgi:hypothetical protein